MAKFKFTQVRTNTVTQFVEAEDSTQALEKLLSSPPSGIAVSQQETVVAKVHDATDAEWAEAIAATMPPPPSVLSRVN